MAVKWETVQAGDVLYDVHSYQMGNTRIRSVGVWEARIVSIDHAMGDAEVAWNGNPAKTWSRRQVQKLRRKRPELEATWSGAQRIKRKAKASG